MLTLRDRVLYEILLYDKDILNPTWTPKVCRIIAFWAVLRSLGPFFYILVGFR